MDANQFAILVLAILVVIGISALTISALRFRYGFHAWILFIVARLYCGLMYHWRSNRRCPFPADGAAIVIANHRSPLDPILLWMNNHHRAERADPRVISFMMASEYYSRPGISWICRAMRSIPVDRDGRDMKATREALRLLKEGEFVGVFPEGGINREERLRKPIPGVAWLALKARVPVYPVFLRGAPRGDSMVEPFITPARVTVFYGDPIDLSDYYDRRITHELLEEIVDLLMQNLADLGQVDWTSSRSSDESHPIEAIEPSAALPKPGL